MKCRMSEEQRKRALCIYEDEQGECTHKMRQFEHRVECGLKRSPEQMLIKRCPFCEAEIINRAEDDIECEECGTRYRVELIG